MGRFLLISGDGDGLGIALRLKEEGHDVTVQVKNKKAKGDYQNLLRRVEKMDDALTPDTVVVFDSTGGGKTADRLRGQGQPVVGASRFADQLELDRSLALGLMQEAGIQVPASQHFFDWASGIQYAEARSERLCFKSDNNKLTSYVSSSPADLSEFLRTQEKAGEAADYELQDVVEGLEISTEGWFDGVTFARPFNHTFEKKQLMNDDVGPSSGCAGNVVWACQHEYCPIVEEGLKRFEPLLAYHGYTGMIDLNTIVNEQGVWALEFTPRFGFDAFPAMMEALTEGVGDLLTKYARGERVTDFPMKKEGFAGGLRVTIPPYPFHDVEAPRGVAIRELVRADRSHSYFYNVFLDEEGQLRTSGAFGAIVVFSSFGADIHKAMSACCDMAARVELKDKQYRTDLGMMFKRAHNQYEHISDAMRTQRTLAEGPAEPIEMGAPST